MLISTIYDPSAAGYLIPRNNGSKLTKASFFFCSLDAHHGSKPTIGEFGSRNVKAEIFARFLKNNWFHEASRCVSSIRVHGRGARIAVCAHGSRVSFYFKAMQTKASKGYDRYTIKALRNRNRICNSMSFIYTSSYRLRVGRHCIRKSLLFCVDLFVRERDRTRFRFGIENAKTFEGSRDQNRGTAR